MRFASVLALAVLVPFIPSRAHAADANLDPTLRVGRVAGAARAAGEGRAEGEGRERGAAGARPRDTGAQVLGTNGQCYGATFATPTVNGGGRFRASGQ